MQETDQLARISQQPRQLHIRGAGYLAICGYVQFTLCNSADYLTPVKTVTISVDYSCALK